MTVKVDYSVMWFSLVFWSLVLVVILHSCNWYMYLSILIIICVLGNFSMQALDA